jgi:hypothetical protein
VYLCVVPGRSLLIQAEYSTFMSFDNEHISLVFSSHYFPLLYITRDRSSLLTMSLGLGFHYRNLDSAQPPHGLISVTYWQCSVSRSFSSTCHPLIFSSLHRFLNTSRIIFVCMIEPLRLCVSSSFCYTNFSSVQN